MYGILFTTDSVKNAGMLQHSRRMMNSSVNEIKPNIYY